VEWTCKINSYWKVLWILYLGSRIYRNSCLLGILTDVVSRLTHYGQADPGGLVSVSQALQEAHQLLHTIKGTNLNLHSKAANHSLKYVNLKYENVSSLPHDRMAGMPLWLLSSGCLEFCCLHF
jgi:hypothetical protein